VKSHPARLAILLCFALGVRAAHGQPGTVIGERGDPYAPTRAAQPVAPQDPNRYPITVQQPAFRFQQPGQQPSGPPPASPQAADPLRYPLPAQNGPPPGQPPVGVVQRPTFGPPPGQPIAVQQPAPPATSQNPGELFQPGQIVAIVGDQFILYGDVAQTVNQMLEPALAKATSAAARREIEEYRKPMTRQVVNEMANTKLLYLAFLRDVEENAGRDKMTEVKQTIKKKVRESFATELDAYRKQVATADKEEIQKMLRRDPTVVRLALMMKENNAESLSELSAILARSGSSLDEQIRQYGEHKLGKQMIFSSIKQKYEVTHQEMLQYYEEHVAEYAVTAKARFEILSVKFANFPGKTEAFNAIATMGNEVYFGAPFSAVARKGSQDVNADKGGAYDWTSQGSLASAAIDQALFTLEPGKLSQIIEDDRGYHILRVIERKDAGQVSFLEAQQKIKDDITAKKREADYKKFLASLGERTKVWTIYDDMNATASQPNGAAQR